MHSMKQQEALVGGGADAHADTHHAAALGERGALLATKSFPTTTPGYRELLGWLSGFGEVDVVAVESTGSYAAALVRYLREHDIQVVEVNQPHAHTRRRVGKSDAIDAEMAARLFLAGKAKAVPKQTNGIAALDRQLERLVRAAAPRTTQLLGISTGHAGQLLVTAGQNIDRLRGEAAFAALCGASPIPASSGKTTRHRLNYGGDRQANRTLHLIAVCRLRYCPRTRAYLRRRTAEGKTKAETMRCLKRYIARETYNALRADLGPAQAQPPLP